MIGQQRGHLLALLIADLNSVSGTPYGLLAPPEVIPEHSQVSPNTNQKQTGSMNLWEETFLPFRHDGQTTENTWMASEASNLGAAADLAPSSGSLCSLSVRRYRASVPILDEKAEAHMSEAQVAKTRIKSRGDGSRLRHES